MFIKLYLILIPGILMKYWSSLFINAYQDGMLISSVFSLISMLLISILMYVAIRYG